MFSRNNSSSFATPARRFLALQTMVSVVTLENQHLFAFLACANNWSKQLPAFSIEPRHLHLLVEMIVGRRAGDHDTRQRQVEDYILEAGGVLHDVLAGEVITATS